MSYEAGDAFECPGCGGTHTVRRGRGLEVGGARAAVESPLYVRCPSAGVVAFPGGAAPPDSAFDEGEDADDWP